MSRPRSDTPKEHTSIIRAKRKDGWTYVQRVVSVYDPKIKNSRRISTETLGKLPPGETDLEKLVTLEPRRRKGSLQAAKIAAPAQEVIIPEIPDGSFTHWILSFASFFLLRCKAKLPARKLQSSGINADPC